MPESPQYSSNNKFVRRRTILIVAATTILALAAAGAYVALRTTEYESSADVLVVPLTAENTAYRGLPLIRESPDGSRPVQSATGLLSSSAVTALAADNLGGDWTQAKVSETVLVEPRGESDIVAITAHDQNADEAARVANTYVRSGLALRRHVLAPVVERELEVLEGEPDSAVAVTRLESVRDNGDPTLSLASSARPADQPSSPGTALVLAAALIVGLLAGVAGVMVLNVATAGPAPRET